MGAGKAFLREHGDDLRFRESLAKAADRGRDATLVLRKLFDSEKERWDEYGFDEPYPQDLENYVRLAVRAGVEANAILLGELTPADFHSAIVGYLQRQKDQQELVDTSSILRSKIEERSNDAESERSELDRKNADEAIKTLQRWIRAAEATLPAEAGNAAQGDDEAEGTPAESDVAHSIDFRSVRWFGTIYSFTNNQAPVVRLLYEHWQAGTPDVGDETLLFSVDPEAPPARLSTLFRDHSAWGTMIVAGGSKGTHRLSTPEA